MSTDREPFNPTDAQLAAMAFEAAFLTVYGRGQGRPEEEEPDGEGLGGHRNAKVPRGEHGGASDVESIDQRRGRVSGHQGRS